ncbi:glycosyltransferase family 2 protein [Microbacterium aureliae]
MSPEPVVTVIIPGNDVAPWAAEALESLRAQTFAAWTAILVDDGSRDATGDIFAAAARADTRFRVVTHPERRGLGAARNTALELVQTPYVGFLDADDRMRPAALERLLAALGESGSEVAAGAYVRLRPDGDGGYEPGEVQHWVAAATDPPRRRTTLAAHPAISGNIVAWSKVSRTELWRREQLRFPVGKAYEDQVVAQRLYVAARGIDTIPDVVVEWRERADGSSITQHRERLDVLKDYLEALDGGIEVLRGAGLDDAVRARVALILRLDLPPLIEIAREHRDPAYRHALGVFVRALAGRWGAAVEEPVAEALRW